MAEIEMHHPYFILNLPVIMVIFISFTILLWIVTKLFPRPVAGNKNLPPSPPRIPILGNLHQIGGGLIQHELNMLANKYGPDLMILHFGSNPTLIVSSAAAAREIMKTHDLTFANRFHYGVQKKLFYDGKDISFAPYGEVWRQLKSILVLHLLSKKMVQSFQAIREEETALIVRKIKDSFSSSSSSPSPVNLSKLFSELTNNGICRSAFGRKYSDSENGKKYQQLLTEFSELLGTISIGDVIPWLGWIKSVNGLNRRIGRVVREIDNFLEDLIQERTETSQDVVTGESFVDMILEIYNDKSSGLSVDRDSIKGSILDVYAGGTDTTYSVLEWAMTELLRHRRVLEKLQNEVREIVGDRHDITGEDLERMQYLKAVIKETFRYRPPSPFLVPRLAGSDVKVMGYDIPAGTMVMVNVCAIGRDPVAWKEPEKFEPERFLNSSIDFKGLDFELIPFGAGRRSCPGIAFSTATIEFVLAHLVQKFNWELPDGANGEDMDMSERPGVSSHRVLPLLAVATQTR